MSTSRVYVYAEDLDTAVRLESVRCERRDAEWAVCETCCSLLRGEWPRGLGSSLWLHSHGNCAEPRYTFYRIA